MLSSNHDMEYTQKDVDTAISDLEKLPFETKIGLLAVMMVSMVFSKAPTDGNQPSIQEEQ